MKTKAFRIVVGIAAAYHILLAAVGFLAPTATIENAITLAFGVGLEIDPVLELLVKFTSVYMLAFGVMLLLISSDPVKYRVFSIPALVLFGLRFVNRLVFFGALTTAGMTTSRNVAGTAIILFFFVAILVSLPKNKD